jgi:uncharacterized protein (TIGR02145 family)
MVRILFLIMVPFVSISQITPMEDILVNSLLKEKENLDTKRKASFNLDEIKVRWKKAALENCPGVPCIVAPSFTCGTSTVTDVDNNIYNTIAIGTGTTAQCWTKTNLRVTKYNDGTPIPDETANSSWGILLTGARTNYTGVTGYDNTFGYLYNWYAAAGIITAFGSPTKKICPTGWHVPTDSDWNKLVKFIHSGADTSGTFVTQSSIAGGKMKSTATNPTPGAGFGWDPDISTMPGTDDFGFAALPGGFRSSGTGSFILETAYFWTASPVSSSDSYLRRLYNNSGQVDRFDDSNSNGYSVRCLKD